MESVNSRGYQDVNMRMCKIPDHVTEHETTYIFLRFCRMRVGEKILLFCLFEFGQIHLAVRTNTF